MGGDALPFGERIVDPIEVSGITVELELFAELPHSADRAPLTRINQMMALEDGSGRIFLTELRGQLYEISSGEPVLYMDYIGLVPELMHQNGLGSGLGSVAFHPEYSENGIFYTVHTEKFDPSLATIEMSEREQRWASTGVVTEWTDLDTTDAVFEGERRELFRTWLPSSVHGFQQISFNPNVSPGDVDYGMLYICLGESGSVGSRRSDQLRNLSSPLGCILRIDPVGQGGAWGDYGIPSDNPWAEDGNPDTLGEIWCMGMRNPHRISWDRGGSGRMFFGDIGELRVEELNIAEAGRDYGWPIREGNFRIDPNGLRFEVFTLTEEDETSESDLTYPVAQYDHLEGNAISGGGVYRGSLLPDLYGKYVFGDIVRGRLFFVEESELELGSMSPIYEFFATIDGSLTSMARLNGGGRADLRFGFDAKGELYIFEKGQGRVYKVVASSSRDEPVELEVTGADRQRNEYSRLVDPADAIVSDGESPLIDDFEDGDTFCSKNEGRDGQWQIYVEGTSGTVDFSVVEVDDSPAGGSSVLHISGSGRSEGGGVVVLPLLGEKGLDGMHFDVSAYDGIQYWVKSNDQGRLNLFIGTAYTVPESRGGLCTGDNYDCDDRYRAKTSRNEGWKFVKIEFSRYEQDSFPNDGPLDPSILKETGFSTRARSDFEFWVDDIQFFKNE